MNILGAAAIRAFVAVVMRGLEKLRRRRVLTQSTTLTDGRGLATLAVDFPVQHIERAHLGRCTERTIRVALAAHEGIALHGLTVADRAIQHREQGQRDERESEILSQHFGVS
jgi:hypothetical protein